MFFEMQWIPKNLQTKFLPALFGNKVTDDEAFLYQLKKGNLAVGNPTETTKCNFDTSIKNCATLISSTPNEEKF